MSTVTEQQMIDVKDIRENMYTDLFYKKVESMVYKAFDGLSDDNILEMIEAYKIYNTKGFDGCIYFVKDNNRNIIKIGMTRNLKKRINDFNQAYDFCGIDSNIKIVACFMTNKEHLVYAERYFHKLFEKYLKYREWYDISEENLLKIINDIQYEKSVSYYSSNNVLYFSYNIGVEYLKLKNFKCDYSFIYNSLDFENKNKCKYLSSDKILHDVMIHNICSDYKIGCVVFSYENDIIKSELKTSYCQNSENLKIFTYQLISDYFVKNLKDEFNADNINKLK